LKDFLPEFKKHFDNVRFIRNARVPLLQGRDMQTGIAIDFCIGNHLAIQKSELLRAYCHCDDRVCQLGTAVKEWAKARQLTGLQFLNNYTYVIMVVHYLQSCDPPVVPNLQAGHPGTHWDSQNSRSLEELLLGFFELFGHRFNWKEDAVCTRLNQAGAPIKKLSLDRSVKASQWYIADPLEPDTFNNAKCTLSGQTQILEEMQETARNLRERRPWKAAYGSPACFLQCRAKLQIPESTLFEKFGEFGITEITSPRQGLGRDASVHLHFPDQDSLQRSLTKTGESFDGCEVALHVVSSRLCSRTSALPDTPPQLEVLQSLMKDFETAGKGALRADAPEFVPQTTSQKTATGYIDMSQDTSAEAKRFEGVATNMGVKFYKIAANQSYAEAQFQLGACYDNGQGVAQDRFEAVKFYKMAADQGHARAQCNLGICYKKPRALPRRSRGPIQLGNLLHRPRRWEGRTSSNLLLTKAV